ncbi:MAG: hypothetical protein WD894_09425 [Pirellulales bacterium]
MNEQQQRRIRLALLVICTAAGIGTAYAVWQVPLTAVHMAALAAVLLLALLAGFAVIYIAGAMHQPPPRPRQPILWPALLHYAALGAPVINGLASVVLMLTFYDPANLPLTICLDIYLTLSAISLLALVASFVLWDREGKRFWKGRPDPRGPSHN